MSCDTRVEAIHTPGRPPPWCVPALECMAKSLLRTRNVGSPHAWTSCASGSARQISRRRARALRAPGDFFATDFFAADFFAGDFFWSDFFATAVFAARFVGADF